MQTTANKTARNIWFSLVLLCTFGFFAPRAHAEHAGPVAVAVYCSCDDAVGKAYVDAVKTALSNESSYRQVAFTHAGEEDVLSINIISMPITNDGKPSSALSIVCMHNGSMVHQFIETCNKIPLEDCARKMVDGLRDVL
jgi:hypothetical protein